MTTIERAVGAGARLVQSTCARGRITRLDTSAAETLTGVLAVLTHRNAPRLGEVAEELLVLQQPAAASGAGGSTGMTSWGPAVLAAAAS